MTRMLVPKLRDRKGMGSDLHGCTGATMEDGTRYLANRSGAFDVDRPDHVRAMRRDPNIAGDIVAETFHAQDSRPGRVCGCSPATYWAWTKSCPRCGADLTDEDKETSDA